METELNSNPPFRRQIAPDSTEHLRTKLIVLLFSIVGMAWQTGTTVPQVWPSIRRTECVNGPIRSTPAKRWWTRRRRPKFLPAQKQWLEAFTVNTLTLKIAGNISFVLVALPENMDAHWDQFSKSPVMDKMESAPIPLMVSSSCPVNYLHTYFLK